MASTAGLTRRRGGGGAGGGAGSGGSNGNEEERSGSPSMRLPPAEIRGGETSYTTENGHKIGRIRKTVIL